MKLPLLLVLCALPALAALADQPVRPPEKHELRLIHIFEGKEPEHVFTIGDAGFKTVASLKAYLATLPAGSEITWAPGCVRFGKEPLLSSPEAMQDFRSFLKARGITLVLVPSG